MNTISKGSKEKIYRLIDGVVVKYLKRAEIILPNNAGNPFVRALFDDFEPLLHNIHGAKTSLGNEMEKIAEIIAKDSWGKDCVRRKINVIIKLPINVFRTIETITNNLSNARKLSNYSEEKNRILEACNNPIHEFETRTYQFDMELYDSRRRHWYYLEMKGPDPNTTEVPGAKVRLMTEMAWAFYENKYVNVDALFAIYYNNEFPKPYRNPKVLYYFDPDGGLLVHDEFWNFLGRSDNTFKELVAIFKEYGDINKKKIWDGFSKLIRLK